MSFRELKSYEKLSRVCFLFYEKGILLKKISKNWKIKHLQVIFVIL
jgi:hypothetical protein